MRIESSFHTVDYSSQVPSQASQQKEQAAVSNPQPSSQKERNQKIQEEQLIAQLRRIDQKVRAHEMAHLSVAGELARGGASYGYAKGPDGKQYAVSGEVPIDTSPAKTPEETIKKMQRVIAAALAPADPSPQDLKIAAKAAQEMIRAQMEYTKNQQEMQESTFYAVA